MSTTKIEELLQKNREKQQAEIDKINETFEKERKALLDKAVESIAESLQAALAIYESIPMEFRYDMVKDESFSKPVRKLGSLLGEKQTRTRRAVGILTDIDVLKAIKDGKNTAPVLQQNFNRTNMSATLARMVKKKMIDFDTGDDGKTKVYKVA